jgi:hypothetical protein
MLAQPNAFLEQRLALRSPLESLSLMIMGDSRSLFKKA